MLIRGRRRSKKSWGEVICFFCDLTSTESNADVVAASEGTEDDDRDDGDMAMMVMVVWRNVRGESRPHRKMEICVPLSLFLSLCTVYKSSCVFFSDGDDVMV